MALSPDDAHGSGLILADGLAMQQFEATMIGLGHDRRRAKAMTDYVCRVPALAGGPFGVADIATGPDGCDRKLFDRLCHMLEQAKWSWVALRRGLLASAIATGIVALTIEIRVLANFNVDSDEDPPQCGDDIAARREDGRDLIALVAVGDGWSTPVGWACVEHPPPIAGHSGAIRSAVINLIEELVAEWPQLAHDEVLPPIVCAFPRFNEDCFGEDWRLRAELAGRGLEYKLAAMRDYNEVKPVLHPFETTIEGRTLAELLPGDPRPPADLLELESTDRSHGEFALALPGGLFDLIHPEPVVPEGALRGDHPQHRARELAAIEIPAPTVIDGLRVADFKHRSTEGVIRHAWLVSTFSATSRGRFTVDGEVCG